MLSVGMISADVFPQAVAMYLQIGASTSRDVGIVAWHVLNPENSSWKDIVCSVKCGKHMMQILQSDGFWANGRLPEMCRDVWSNCEKGTQSSMFVSST